MTFKSLRIALIKDRSKFVQWNCSGIIELATLESTGAIRISNIISGKSYILPRRYFNVDVRVIQSDNMITIGNLSPKLSKF